MVGAQPPMPEGGASDVPQGGMGGPGLGGDGGEMGGTDSADPNADSAGPGMGPSDGMGPDNGMDNPEGNGQLDPNMGGMGPGEEGDEMMDDGEPGTADDDSTMALFQKLDQDGQKAARGYIESLLPDENATTGPDGENATEDNLVPPDGGGAPMAESYTFTKGQLKKVYEVLKRNPKDEEERGDRTKKRGNHLNNNSPFNAPKFK